MLQTDLIFLNEDFEGGVICIDILFELD